MFHVSNLKKCMFDEPLAIPLDEIQVDDKLYFIEEHVEIMDHEVKRLKQSRILIVKVRWNSKRGPEFTWEREDQIQKKYPHLFPNSAPLAYATSDVTPPDAKSDGTLFRDLRIKSRKYTSDKSFTLGSTEAVDNVNILQSCNEPDYAHDDSKFYGCARLRLAFDPTKSPDYKVVRTGSNSCEIVVQIYSLETGN
ncbi:hypothetical protein Tco_1309849 [Tanacetum coccineum]